MARNVLLAAIGGAAAGVAIANYLNSDKGRQMLSSASETLTDLKGKASERISDLKGRATDFAQNRLSGRTENKDVVQPS